MSLSQEAVTSFQRLYHQKRGVKLDYDEAETQALMELKRFALIYRPIPKVDQACLAKLQNEK